MCAPPARTTPRRARSARPPARPRARAAPTPPRARRLRARNLRARPLRARRLHARRLRARERAADVDNPALAPTPGPRLQREPRSDPWEARRRSFDHLRGAPHKHRKQGELNAMRERRCLRASSARGERRGGSAPLGSRGKSSKLRPSPAKSRAHTRRAQAHR